MNQFQIYQEYVKAKHRSILIFVQRYIIDGNVGDKYGVKHRFLATNGSWQAEYLSLYEVLHDKYVAKYFAQTLLDDYIYPIQRQIDQINKTNAPEKIKKESIEKLWKGIIFDKIVTVTVSSQLIGVAMRELIRKNDKYTIFRNPEEPNSLKASPGLLILSSYYSFDNEKPFKKIEKGNNVVIVNDVISTGNLVYNLIDKITTMREANVNAVFSIADTRIETRNIKDAKKEAVYKFGTLEEEKKFYSLLSFDDGIEIRKYKKPHPLGYGIKRINPLLNSIVELKLSHSEEKRILFPNPQEIINEATFKESYFKIGHFQQGLTHNSYLTDMHNIFSCETEDDTGRQLLNKLRNALEKSHATSDRVNIVLNNINHNIEVIKKSSFAAENLTDISRIEITVNSLIEKRLQSQILFAQYKPDFIFYPIFSGIEQLDHSVLNKEFDTPIENIIGLQRFDTNKGWRFPFPAKRYNQLTKNKSVLIIDSGSLTGESLVQLIDMIAFLDVKEITLLSVISRIEDFYREFYSRLKSIKVKLLQPSQGFEPSEKENQPEHIIPLNVLFGVNLHIPVYPSSTSCPFCNELEEIKKYEELSERFTPSQWTKNYFKERKNEIKLINLGLLDEHKFPPYIPQNRRDNNIDAIELLLMRDRIGKIESYRFYPEYFKYFDDVLEKINPDDLSKNKEKLKIFEQILIVILHEPRLLDTVKDLLVDVKEGCSAIIDSLISRHIELSDLYYVWSKYAILRLSINFFKEEFLDIKTWEKAFEFALGDERALNYLSFLLWEGFLGKSNFFNKHVFIDVISYFSDKLDKSNFDQNELYKDDDFRKIIKGIIHNFAITRVNNINDAYFNLRKFFFSQNSNSFHSELSRNIFQLTSRVQNIDLTIQDFNDILTIIANIHDLLYNGILENLIALKECPPLKIWDELQFNNLFKIDGIFEKLKIILLKCEEIQSDRINIISRRDVQKLNEIGKVINQFHTEYLLNDSDFTNYCKSYKCNLFRCISKSIFSSHLNRLVIEKNKSLSVFDEIFIDETVLNSDEDKLKSILSLKNDLKQIHIENIYVNGNEFLFIHAFEEIFNNCVNHIEENHINIEIIIKEIGNGIQMLIIQNSSFDKQKGLSGIKNIIIPIFEAFCGKDNVKLNYDAPNFSIQLFFNTHQLNY